MLIGRITMNGRQIGVNDDPLFVVTRAYTLCNDNLYFTKCMHLSPSFRP